MISRLEWLKLIFLRYYRDMGLRVFLYAALSLVATLISPVVNLLLDEQTKAQIDFTSVVPVLTILATSMLAVSTFSLNIMVTAHRAAASAATPRVHRILLENTTTQSVLAVFIGAFVYSLSAIVLYRLGFYPEDAAMTVMGITTLVVALVVLSLLRWIKHLTKLGSVEDSLASAKERAREVLLAQARQPRSGASELSKDTVLPTSTMPLLAPETGYLQLIDMVGLQGCLPDTSAIYLFVRPGVHVLEGEVIAQISGHVDANAMPDISGTFTFGETRTHEQDAEFGLSVVSEIASKALSPGVNDPGTAIEALLVLKSLLWEFAREDAEEENPSAPRVFAAFPGPVEFVNSAFAPIARDGAGTIEVALHLRQALRSLSSCQNPRMSDAARQLAEVAISYAEEAGLPERDMVKLRSIEMPPQDGHRT